MQAYLIWGSELSPFALKIEALLRYAGLPYRCLPREGTTLENLRFISRLRRAARHGTIQRYGGMTAQDEYPQVPFLAAPDGTLSYDSSGIARWLDSVVLPQDRQLFPDDPVLGFVAQLLDETFDEFGLYMVHHMRWVASATDNDAGDRLAAEFGSVLPPGTRRFLSRRFSRRQVRRLPYLFSVPDVDIQQTVTPGLRAPRPQGWPATHKLLEDCWYRTLSMMEQLLGQQAYLLGDSFTVADASLYGELAINMDDGAARQLIRQTAPAVFDWLQNIREGRQCEGGGGLTLSPSLQPMLQFAMATFVPLMQQNARAWQASTAAGNLRFNEDAHDRGEALYDGELCGSPYRSVVKSFQVRVWLDLCQAWQGLDPAQRATLQTELPGWQTFDTPFGD